MRIGGRILPALAAVAALSGVGSASAETAAEFYKGKSVAFIVASGAGGGYDLYARTIARTWPKYLAGNPTIIVQNMPGASGVRAMNYVYNVAAKDGTVVGLLQNFSSLAPFYEVKQAQFDSTKFNWLGSPSQEDSVFVVWHDAPMKTMAEGRAQEILLGSAGAAGTGPFYARVMGEVFELNYKLIQGYRGLTGAFLAMERGEIKGYPSVFWTTLKSTKADWIKEGKIRFPIKWTDTKDPELRGVPFAGDLAKSEEDKKMIEIAAVPLKLGRPVAAPPGVPSDRLAALKGGLEAAFRDEGYLKDCKQQSLDCASPVAGETLAEIIRNAHAAPAGVRRRLIEIYYASRKKKE